MFNAHIKLDAFYFSLYSSLNGITVWYACLFGIKARIWCLGILLNWGDMLWFNGSNKCLLSDQNSWICKLRRFSDWWKIILYQHGNLADPSNPKDSHFNEADHSFHVWSVYRLIMWRLKGELYNFEGGVYCRKLSFLVLWTFFFPFILLEDLFLPIYNWFTAKSRYWNWAISFQSLLRYLSCCEFGNSRTVLL